MARFAKGSRALAISDRSGAAFPYREMVKEWTGAFVHNSEFEPKQPQLEPHPVGADPQGLLHARPARVEFPVTDILPENPFQTYQIGSPIVNVALPGHGYTTGDVRRIQDVGAYTNASDTPFRFVPCMVSGLSYYLSMKFAPQRTQEMKLLYEDELARALSEDGSAASTFITPKTYYPNI